MITKKRNEVFFIRVTTINEIKRKKEDFGDYWRFVERKDKLKEAIESNTAYVISRNKIPYVIVGKGNYKELELEVGISLDNEGEQLYYSKWLFDKEDSPSSKILYKGSVKNLFKKYLK